MNWCRKASFMDVGSETKATVEPVSKPPVKARSSSWKPVGTFSDWGMHSKPPNGPELDEESHELAQQHKEQEQLHAEVNQVH